MVYQSMRNDSRGADTLYITRVLLALENILSSLFTHSLVQQSKLQLSNSFNSWHVLISSIRISSVPCLVWDITSQLSISPMLDPARYTSDILTILLLDIIDIQVCNRIYLGTFIRGHTRAYTFTQLSLLQFQICFAYWIS